MAVIVNLPAGIEALLRREYPDLDLAAKEALAIEGYRSGRLSLGAVAEMLGLATTIEALDWLARRGVPLNDDERNLEDDRRTLRAVLKSAL